MNQTAANRVSDINARLSTTDREHIRNEEKNEAAKERERQLRQDASVCVVCGNASKPLEPGFRTCKGCTTDTDRMTHTVETIDITPESLKTAEGAAKVGAAITGFDDASHALSNAVIEFFDTHEDDMLAAMDKYERDNAIEGFREDLHQVRALIAARNRKQDAMLKAIAGR